MSNSFDTMLDCIGARPGMYLGGKSLTMLDGWIQGWIYAKRENAFEGTNPSFGEFHDWVALRLAFYESTSGWRLMWLKESADDEEAAFDRFFELLNEFRSRQSRVVMYASVDLSKKSDGRVDSNARIFPESWPSRLEILKYTDDAGVFLRFIDEAGSPYRDEYCPDLTVAVSRSEWLVSRDDWINVQLVNNV